MKDVPEVSNVEVIESFLKKNFCDRLEVGPTAGRRDHKPFNQSLNDGQVDRLQGAAKGGRRGGCTGESPGGIHSVN